MSMSNLSRDETLLLSIDIRLTAICGELAPSATALANHATRSET